jgi:hypothetical protein
MRRTRAHAGRHRLPSVELSPISTLVQVCAVKSSEGCTTNLSDKQRGNTLGLFPDRQSGWMTPLRSCKLTYA